ncbi:hypothetical protein Aperf_G00000004365 [Anoplocephala perfoliata]
MLCTGLCPRFAIIRRSLPFLQVKYLPRIQARFASYLRYTDDHGWVRCNGNTATVGITKHAANLYGDIMYIKLPNPGEIFKKGDTIGNAESTKAASDITAPVSGKVESVNSSLYENLQILNKAPEGDGWLVKIEMSSPKELGELMTEEEYKKYLEHNK